MHANKSQGADTSQLTCLTLVLLPDHFTLVGRAQEWRNIQRTFGQLRQLDELDLARGHPDLIGKRPHKAEESRRTRTMVTTGARTPGDRRGNRQRMNRQGHLSLASKNAKEACWIKDHRIWSKLMNCSHF